MLSRVEKRCGFCEVLRIRKDLNKKTGRYFINLPAEYFGPGDFLPSSLQKILDGLLQVFQAYGLGHVFICAGFDATLPVAGHCQSCE